MADDVTSGAQPISTVIIPDDVKAKFPELLDLIMKSESMNDGERQYWVNILPVMNEEQIQNLKTILDNERSQLHAIDEKYAKSIENLEQQRSLEEVSKERTARADERKSAESQAKEEEEKATESLLSEIDTH